MKAFKVILAGVVIGEFVECDVARGTKHGFKARMGFRLPRPNDITQDYVPGTFKKTAQECVAWMIQCAVVNEKVRAERIDGTTLSIEPFEKTARSVGPRYVLQPEVADIVSAAVFGKVAAETTSEEFAGEPVKKAKKK